MTQSARLTEVIVDELAQLGVVPTKQRPVDLLFAEQQFRSRSSLVRSHVSTHEYPAGSFLRLSEHVLIVCPELCFIQMDGQVPLTKLIHLGCELCGTYALVGSGGAVEEGKPLMSAASLASYMDACPPRVVGKGARRAAPYILDAAASPRESALALVLSLPHLLGGYGLPVPVLNHPVALGEQAYGLYPCSPVRCDLFWPEVRFAVEYQGELHKERYASDVARAAALQAEGVDVLALTKEQLDDAVSVATVAQAVAVKLGVKLRVRREDFTVRNAALLEALGL